MSELQTVTTVASEKITVIDMGEIEGRAFAYHGIGYVAVLYCDGALRVTTGTNTDGAEILRHDDQVIGVPGLTYEKIVAFMDQSTDPEISETTVVAPVVKINSSELLAAA